jgi:hypothetical protein
LRAIRAKASTRLTTLGFEPTVTCALKVPDEHERALLA